MSDRNTFYLTSIEQHDVDYVPPACVIPMDASAEKGFPHPGSVIELPVGAIHVQYGLPPTKARNGNLITEVIQAIIDHQKVFLLPGHPMACRETAVAITKLEEAIMWLEGRQKRRIMEGLRFKDEEKH